MESPVEREFLSFYHYFNAGEWVQTQIKIQFHFLAAAAVAIIITDTRVILYVINQISSFLFLYASEREVSSYYFF